MFRLLPLLVASCLASSLPAADAPWWAYQPVTRPAVPTVQRSAWARNDLDRFLRIADQVVRHKIMRLPEHEATRRGLLGKRAS